MLRNRTWHIGSKRLWDAGTQRRDQNGFADDLYIHFLENDRVLLRFDQYSPSIGDRSVSMHGTYRFDKDKKEIFLALEEPAGHFTYRGEKTIQYTLHAISALAGEAVHTSDLTSLPVIARYRFSITAITEDKVITRLTLIDEREGSYDFGSFAFDVSKGMESP